MTTIEIYADSRRRAECRGCRAPVEWARVVKSGALMPFDQVVVLETKATLTTLADLENANRAIEVVDLARNHWATCSAREQFRGKRR